MEAQKLEQEKTFIVTKMAAERLKEFLKKEKKQGWGLKIEVLSGGCAGSKYGMTLQEKQSKGDIVVEENGVKVFLEGSMLDMIKGSTLDYVDGLQHAGFKIDNPNAVHSCGCGDSFA